MLETESKRIYLNAQLGYISLQQRLANDEVLAVAYQYTHGDQAYQVGEFGMTVLMQQLLPVIPFSGNYHSKFSFENAEKQFNQC
jgi:hypothetical protein